MLIAGSCHCGNLSFNLNWAPEPEAIPARACGCTFCTKHGGVWTSCPTGSVEVRIQDPERMSRYLFGTRTAEFHVCAQCGAVPLVTSQLTGRLYAVVNVNTFDNVDNSLIYRAAASFEGEDAQTRLARRARNWIPTVVFSEGSADCVTRTDAIGATKTSNPRNP